jgi:hypothetical protein
MSELKNTIAKLVREAIREQLEDEGEPSNPSVAKFLAAVEELKADISSGKVKYRDLSGTVQGLQSDLQRTSRTALAKNRTPEERKASAAKAKDTRSARAAAPKTFPASSTGPQKFRAPRPGDYRDDSQWSDDPREKLARDNMAYSGYSGKPTQADYDYADRRLEDDDRLWRGDK